MPVSEPKEAFPELGTTANPAMFYDGDDAFLCYEASVRAGGGNVVLKFAAVIDFRITPMNVEGLKDCRYPVQPWAINEVSGASETEAWKLFDARFWIISFNDLAIEVVFESVSLIARDSTDQRPEKTLLGVVC